MASIRPALAAGRAVGPLLCTSGAASGPPLAVGDPSGAEAEPAQPPNIVLFVVDDMGWQDTSVPFHTVRTPLNGRYHTPNMERLAAQGMRFTDFYAACPVCTPTRVSILTGCNPARTRVTNWTLRRDTDTSGPHAHLRPPAWNMNGLSSDPRTPRAFHAPTLPSLLREHGYRSIHVGKAHFGALDTPGADPLNLGFDVNVAGHAAGAPGSYLAEEGYGKFVEKDHVWDVPGLETHIASKTFLTEALTREATREIDRAVADGAPFFLNMAHYAVHVPFAPDPRFYARYREAGLVHTEAMYAALLEGMDRSLGDILDSLERHGIAERTVVLFLSDNGGLSAHGRGGVPHTHNAPLRSGKGSAYEGGIRVPFIVRWPGVTPPGSVCRVPAITDDLLPTLLQMAGAPPPGRVDGRDLTPLLRGRGRSHRGRALLWHYPHAWGMGGPGIEPFSAVRQGGWKLIYFHPDGRYELYDVAGDVSETEDRARAEPARVREMAALLRRLLIQAGAQMPTRIAGAEPVPLPGERAP